MRSWIFRILVFILCISLCINFIRVLVVPQGTTVNYLDFRSVMQALSEFDVDVTPLYRDIVVSFQLLEENFRTIINAGQTILHMESIKDFFSAIYELIRMPVNLVVLFVKVVYDLVLFLYNFATSLYRLFNFFVGGVLGYIR